VFKIAFYSNFFLLFTDEVSSFFKVYILQDSSPPPGPLTHTHTQRGTCSDYEVVRPSKIDPIGFSKERKMLIMALYQKMALLWHAPYTFWLLEINLIIWSTQQCIYSSKIFLCFSRLDKERNCRKKKKHNKISLKGYPEYGGHIIKSRATIRVEEWHNNHMHKDIKDKDLLHFICFSHLNNLNIFGGASLSNISRSIDLEAICGLHLKFYSAQSRS
jgi:hypothetical protein